MNNLIPLKTELSNFSYTSVPDALITYARDTVFYTWQTLEMQLAQVDPDLDSEVYNELDARAATVFNAWLGFRNVDGRR